MIFYLLVLFLALPIFSQDEPHPVKESIQPTKARVWEVFTYRLQYEESLEIHLPEIGDITPKGMDLPVGEVLSVETESEVRSDGLEVKVTEIKIRFFSPGTFTSPVFWKVPQSEEEILQSERRFVVDPSQQEDLREADVLPPWEFGEFLVHRLILSIAVISFIIWLCVFLYKKYKSRVLDAIIEAPFEPPREEWIDKKFRELFQNESVSQKEFAYLLTEYLKHQSKTKFAIESDPLTDQELLGKIYQSSSITKEKLEDSKYFFLYSKYKPNFETLNQSEAEKILNEWKNRLS